MRTESLRLNDRKVTCTLLPLVLKKHLMAQMRACKIIPIKPLDLSLFAVGESIPLIYYRINQNKIKDF